MYAKGDVPLALFCAWEIGNDDLRLICIKYNTDIEDALAKRKRAVWDAFYLSLRH